LDELQRREQVRGNRYVGTAARQFDRVHRYGIYDVEVDTSCASAEASAEQVMTYISNHEPNAFGQLRASF
jgi:chloramphenicol 3-O phosphotransferase